MTNKEMTRLEAKNPETLPSQWLDDLKDEQRTRIELLLEEMTESGASAEGIRHAIKHAHDKEIMFAVHLPEGQDPTPQLRLK
jgi:hypothetical protein